MISTVHRTGLFKIILFNILITFSLLEAKSVVNLKGTMSVEQGALNYKVDLQLPPGIAGVIPKLSMTYNSNRGNGYLGLGWNLSGLSAITRCGSTLIDDGVQLDIQLNEKDNYCLDGQRLVPLYDGSNEYRTQIESFNRIVKNSDNTFTVWGKSGDVYTYGKDDNAKFMYEDKTVSWKLSSISDGLQNPDNLIHFTYNANNAIDTISYANGINDIVFHYTSTRLDKRVQNFRGKLIPQDKELSSIEIKVNGQSVRSYNFQYRQQSNARDMLKMDSITECSKTEGCLEPLSLTWEVNEEESLLFTKAVKDPTNTSEGYKVKVADFNGDGVTDMMRIRDDDVLIYMMNADGNYSGTYHKLGVNTDPDRVQLVDLNGDGLVDIFANGIGYSNIWFNQGQGKFHKTKVSVGVDKRYTTTFNELSWAQISISRLKFVDIDSDGDIDVYGLSTNEFNTGTLTDPELIYQDKIWVNDGKGSFSEENGPEIKVSDFIDEPGYGSFKLRRNQDNIAFFDIDTDGDLDIIMTLPIKAEISPSSYQSIVFRDSYSHRVNVYLNDGNENFTLSQNPKHLNITDNEITSNENTFHQFAELNGDGIPDIIHLETSNTAVFSDTFQQRSFVYLSNASGGWDTQPIALSASYKRTKLADLNGDGMTDIYHLYNQNSGMWFNNGKGNFTLQPDNTTIKLTSDSYKSIDLVDMNGDGFVDIIDKKGLYSAEHKSQIALNNGDGTFTGFIDNIPFSSVDGNYYNTHYGDFNGDGITDVFDTKNGVYINNRQKELITAITDSFKNITKITYEPLSNGTVHTMGTDAGKNEIDMQSSALVVAKTSVGDGLGGYHIKTYHYEGLRYHLFRGSQGFKKISVTDETTGAKTVNEYYQSFPLTGRVWKTQSYLTEEGSEELLSETVATLEFYAPSKPYTINLVQFGSISLPMVTSVKAEDQRKNYLIEYTSEVKRSYMDGALLKESSTFYEEYDAYGNVVEMKVAIKDGNENVVNTKTTLSTYQNIIDDEKWLPGRLLSAEVTHTAPDTDPIIRKSTFTYSDESGMLETETIEPDDAMALTKSYTYDAFGNKETETLSSPSFIDGDRTTTYTYDDNKQFIKTVTNALKHTEKREYNQTTGKLHSVTGPNGLTTTWVYNAWGQKRKELRPDGTWTEWNYTFDNSINNSYYAITQTDKSGKTGTIYHDSYDRKVASKTIGFEGEEIFIETIYNHKGEVEKKSSPYKSGEEKRYIKYEYDKYGRNLKTYTPAVNNQTATTSIDYDGLKVITTDAEGRTKTIEKNVMDKVAFIEEGESTMEYFYDAVGNLVKTLPNNDARHAITMVYDKFGNKTDMYDPNMGHWSYTYNADGKLKTQTDAKGQITTIHYDVLGRVYKKETPEGISTWTYDIGNKAIGKLVEEKNYDGFVKSYTYDKYGRLKSTSTNIDQMLYTESYEYNTNGQLEKVIKPDNFALINLYTDQGYLKEIRSPIAKIKDFDIAHFQAMIDNYHTNALEYQRKYEEYLLYATELKAKAENYLAIAENNTDEAEELESIAAQLKANAAIFEAMALSYEQLADEARAQAAYYQEKADNYSRSWFYLSKSLEYQALADEQNNYAESYLSASDTFRTQAYMALAEANASLESAGELYLEAETNVKLAEENYQLYYTALKQAEYYKRMLEDDGQVSLAYEVMQDAYEDGYAVHYKVLEMDSYGRVTQYLSGNGLINTDSYDDSGAMLTSHTGFYGDNEVRDISYAYDLTYNVTQRKDRHLGVTAHYSEYDELSRIREVQFVYEDAQQTITGMDAMSYAYDEFGNITYKSDIGSYEYDTEMPNRLESAVGTDRTKTFEYDANGNMVYNDGIIIEYNSANKATKIQENGTTIYFDYDMNQNRYRKIQGMKVTHYVGKGFEYTEDGDGTITQKHLIYANGKVVAINTDTYDANHNDLGSTIRYLHYDALGSVDTITDNRGLVLERRAYKPFGEQLEVYKKEGAGFTTNRGYAGHEHIEGTRLIHMNARLYDPTLGRFLSADTIVQDPYDTQAFNRYSYVRNNPLKYTDPSGHSWISNLFKTLMTVFITVVAYSLFGPGGALVNQVVSAGTAIGLSSSVAIGAAMGATVGFTMTLVNGGSFKDALIGGLKGALFAGISAGMADMIADWTGELFYKGDTELGHAANFFSKENFVPALAKASMHGLSRGIMSIAQGDKFSAGFASGFVSSGFDVGTSRFNSQLGTDTARMVRTVIMGMVGGTTSVITGGKFSNGAISGAFIHLFNAERIISKWREYQVLKVHGIRGKAISLLPSFAEVRWERDATILQVRENYTLCEDDCTQEPIQREFRIIRKTDVEIQKVSLFNVSSYADPRIGEVGIAINPWTREPSPVIGVYK